jgi:beta-glucosidase
MNVVYAKNTPVAVPRLGFQGLCLQDGPLAIRVADYASVFSAGVSAGGKF